MQSDISLLTEPISRLQIERSNYRVKLRHAAGLDGIPEEVLRNPVCIDLMYKIVNFCFESGTVLTEWNRGIIRPIPKSDSKDPRNPMNYLGICLILI